MRLDIPTITVAVPTVGMPGVYSTKVIRGDGPVTFFDGAVGEHDPNLGEVLTYGHTNVVKAHTIGIPSGSPYQVLGLKAEVYESSVDLFAWMRQWILVSFTLGRAPNLVHDVRVGPLGLFWWVVPVGSVVEGYLPIAHHPESARLGGKYAEYGEHGVHLPSGGHVEVVFSPAKGAPPPPPDRSVVRLTLAGHYAWKTEVG